MPIETLTDARVRGLKHDDGEIIDTRSGLIARADTTGAVTFSFRYRAASTRHRIILGRYPALPLAEARIAIGRVREQVRTGENPQAQRRASRDAQAAELTFDALSDLYLERYARRQKASWQADARYLRADARPAWGLRKASTITRQDAARLLFSVAARAPVVANRLRSVLVKLFGWAVDSALLEDSPMLGTKKPHREGRGKTRALNDSEIRVLWHALDNADTAPGIVAALKVLLLTGQRPGEVAGMVVGELHHLDDARAATWELPASRMKARRPHTVPLVPLARKIVLAELARPRGSEFVFAAGFARLGRNSLARALVRLIAGLDGDATAVVSLKADRPVPHDFRRTVASGMSRLRIPRDDRLAVLAHAWSPGKNLRRTH